VALRPLQKWNVLPGYNLGQQVMTSAALAAGSRRCQDQMCAGANGIALAIT
jgi:hypothetical protein